MFSEKSDYDPFISSLWEIEEIYKTLKEGGGEPT